MKTLNTTTMEDLKFKDIAHFYPGSYVIHNEEQYELVCMEEGRLLLKQNGETWFKDAHTCKPILFPLSAMTHEQVQEIGLKPHPKEWDMNTECYYRPKTFLWLLRNHFNIFNLPESEYIDASKLLVNPYSKP